MDDDQGRMDVEEEDEREEEEEEEEEEEGEEEERGARLPAKSLDVSHFDSSVYKHTYAALPCVIPVTLSLSFSLSLSLSLLLLLSATHTLTPSPSLTHLLFLSLSLTLSLTLRYTSPAARWLPRHHHLHESPQRRLRLPHLLGYHQKGVCVKDRGSV